MTAPKASYQVAADVFDDWRDDLLRGEPPKLYAVGAGELARIEIGPGLVVLIGGAPGAGKTAFTMQCVVDALRLDESLRVLVANVEMPPAVLLDRQLARLAGIDATVIRHRRLEAEHADRLDQGLQTLEILADRLAFLRHPFTLANAAAAADAFEADLLVLDYIQRIRPGDGQGDRRESVDLTMSALRRFADAGLAVIAVSSVARQKNRQGSATYDANTLSLASFRESSELEFGADSAFILAPEPKTVDRVRLMHLKSRHGETRDIVLRFDKPHQSFEPLAGDEPHDNGKVLDALAELWDQAHMAGDDAEGGAF